MLLDLAKLQFPNFAKLALDREPSNILPPAIPSQIDTLQESIGLARPESYKTLLQYSRGFYLLGGAIQFQDES